MNKNNLLNNLIKKHKLLLLFCSIGIFGLIFTICSTTSPLYPFEDESHCFFTVGKAILNGRVLYRDILEQKGLLTYLIQIPAYLISNTNFLGVWIMQLLCMIPSAILAYKISNKILKSSTKSCIATILFALIIFTSQSLGSGQTVEVYVLPFFLYSIYNILKYYEDNKEIPYLSIFINGIFAGIIFWMKYSLIGFYAGWMGYICIRLLIKKDIKRAILDAVVFILGFVLVTIPCILYFVINDSVSELFKYYFLVNISEYGQKITLINLLVGYAKTIVKQTLWNFPMILSMLIGLIYLKKKIKLESLLILIISFFMHFLVIFSHGAMMPYYLFAFASSVIFASIAITDFITSKISLQSNKKKIISVIITSVASTVLALIFLPCPRQFLKDPSELAQYQFAEYMHSKYENPTSLDYGFLDGGFYTVANTVPNTWAFCQNNLDDQDMKDDQLNTIKNKKVNFVILRQQEGTELEDIEYLEENYNLVKKVSQYRVNTLFTYYLYEVK